MAKLVAAMDASGNPHTSNYRYIGIVIGTQEKINAITRRAKYTGASLSTIKNKNTRMSIISSIVFDGNESTAFCMRVDRGETLDELIRTNAKRGKAGRKKIYAVCNRATAYYIRQAVHGFLLRHGQSIRDVVFECDSDCLGIARDGGMRYAEARLVHGVADAVAWSNNRNIDPKGANRLDRSADIRRMCYKNLK